MAFDRFPSDFATLVVPPFDSELDNFKASLDEVAGRATLGKKLWVTWLEAKIVFSQIRFGITYLRFDLVGDKTYLFQIKSEPERDSPDVPHRPAEL